MHIHKYIDPFDLQLALEQKLVFSKPHEKLPYRLLGYTPAAQYNNAWDLCGGAPRKCRGLIYNHQTGQIVARPFEKFFNLHEHTTALPDRPFRVEEKVDGSLGLLFPLPGGGHAIATRGSFSSPQALWATNRWNTDYAHKFSPQNDRTYLVEIVYPENRIVVDYWGIEDLYLLAVIDNETGASIPLPSDWPALSRTHTDEKNLDDFLERVKETNQDGTLEEGFVLVWDYPDAPSLRVKVKYPDYLRLHRIMTGVSTTTIWEVLQSDGKEAMDKIAAECPDEMHNWIKTQVSSMVEAFSRIENQADVFLRSRSMYMRNASRKDWALQIKAVPDRTVQAVAFAMLDSKPFDSIIWKALKPAHSKLYFNLESESV